MLARQSEGDIEWVKMEEILDLSWPTDSALVRSFRHTLQRGEPFIPIQLNRVWHEDTTKHYEIIDGFHRYEAAKAEHIDVLRCQVVEKEERDARLARIQACLFKPSAVTGERALLELRKAFVADMQTLIGQPAALYEPILGEDGQVQARPRSTPLSENPYQALEALTDHLLATRSAYPAYRVHLQSRGWAQRTPFGRRTGWEQALNDWLAEMGEQFGYDASWLLELLHLQLFDNFLGPRRWYRRRGQPLFSEEREYAEFAFRLWQIPDVDLRALFRRRLEEQPQERAWLAKVQDLLHLNGFPEPGQTRNGPSKREILRLLTDAPSMYALFTSLRKRQPEELLEPDDRPLATPVGPDHHPQPVSASGPSKTSAETAAQDSAIFAIGSDSFVSGSPHPSTRIEKSLPSAIPSGTQAIAYQPVHEACAALLSTAQRLTEQYGTAWLQWEGARADIARLQAVFRLD